MTNTDKYEGHLAHLDYELWAFTDFMNINATHKERCATDALLNDAPLLLAEVKRLREQLIQAEDWVRVEGGHIFETSEDRLKHYKEYIGEKEE